MAENVGDVLTYKILDEETGQIVNRSVVRSALDGENINLRAGNSTEDEKSGNKIVSTSDITVPAHDSKEQRLPKFSPEQLIGQTFLYDTTGGQRVRSEVVRKLATLDATNHQNIKFLVKTGDVEEVMGYVELSDAIEEQIQDEVDHPDKYWTYKSILDHEGPLRPGSPTYKGLMYNVLVLWEDNTKTWEPLNIVIKDDPVQVAGYALDKNLL